MSLRKIFSDTLSAWFLTPISTKMSIRIWQITSPKCFARETFARLAMNPAARHSFGKAKQQENTPMSTPILVTGSAGFIGFHLCQRLLSDGFDVIGLDAMTDYYDVPLK